MTPDQEWEDICAKYREVIDGYRQSIRFWKAMAYTFMVTSAVYAIAVVVIAMGGG